MAVNEALFDELAALLSGAGISLVELSVGRGSVRTRATVYVPGGTGTSECAKAHRIIHPRLQAFLGGQEPILEVASPGIDRALRAPREWRIFAGRRVRVLLKEDAALGLDWISGGIKSAGDEGVVLATDTGERGLRFDEIAKARLDSTREGD
jgi:ribosome maturation factor RimP